MIRRSQQPAAHVRNGDTEKRDGPAEGRYDTTKNRRTGHCQKTRSPHVQTHRARITLAEQERIQLLRRRSRYGQTCKYQRDENRHLPPRHTTKRTEPPTHPILQFGRFSTRHDDGGKRLRGVPEHQADNQYGRRALHARRQSQYDTEGSRRARDRACRYPRITSETKTRTEDACSGDTAGQDHQRDSETRPGSNAEGERVRQRVSEKGLHLKSRDAESGTGEKSSQRARQANGLNDQRVFRVLTGAIPDQDGSHTLKRNPNRPERQR